jgi:lincosamide nucleotidyltransferase A/C/D/E
VLAQDVLAVVRSFEASGLSFWLDGGWGVDLLLGEQSRDHSDMDVVIVLKQFPDVCSALEPLGFEVVEDHLPTRAVLRSPDGRLVDVHPVTFDEDGTGWQHAAGPGGTDCPYPAEGFTHGSLLGHAVPCLTAEMQIEHHRGYEPQAHDRADMTALGRTFGLDLPAPY